MTQNEQQAWADYMKSCRGKWSLDPIHNGTHGKGHLFFVLRDAAAGAGTYVTIDPAGKADAGEFTGAIPHMGEACYRSRWSKQFENQSDAFARLVERLGIGFLFAMTHGTSPYHA